VSWRQTELKGIEGWERGISLKQNGVLIRQKIIDGFIEVDREDEMRLWISKADLAVSYIQDERFDEAGAIMESAVLQYRKWGTEAEYPFEHAKWFNYVAFIRLWQGFPDDALEMARHEIELQTIACGVDGSLTLMKRFFMAHMLYIACKWLRLWRSTDSFWMMKSELSENLASEPYRAWLSMVFCYLKTTTIMKLSMNTTPNEW